MKLNKKLNNVQDFIPVKDIRYGIIETTDGRYIKLLEIEPINFMLRSEDEQYSIISSFASWLKISPVSIQFKSITRKADTDNHLKVLRQELHSERDEKCWELGESYMNLIRDVGSKEALTRRFFLIVQYESPRRNDDFNLVYATLQNVEQNARAYFSQCGNNIVHFSNPNEDVSEILYTYFNRNSCVKEPFVKRVERVVMDYMRVNNRIIGVDEVPEFPVVDLIAPRGIDFTNSKYTVMDGRYYTVLYIKGDGYPSRVRAGWLSNLVNAGEGIDVDVFLKKQNKSKTVDKVAQAIRLRKTKLKDMQDTSVDYEEVTNSIQAGYYIKQEIATRNEDLIYMSIFITVSAKTKKELAWRKQQVVDMLKAIDIFVSDAKFKQQEALMSVMPFLQMDKSLEKKSKRNVLTTGAASSYMFTSFELSDDNGVLLGVNQHNNSLCIVDLFNSKKNKNANMNLIGTSGAGKTFTMQLLALRMRMRGIQSFILAPIKGHEFKRACKAIGGSYIKIAPGSPHCINIMEIRPTTTPELELIDSGNYHESDSILARKIQQLTIFFALLIPDMTNEEEQLLDEALIKTYKDFGINYKNRSLYIESEEKSKQLKKMPILGDLHKNLLSNKRTERLAIILSRFVTGSAQSFNRQTNVDLSNKYIVIDLSELKGKMLPVGMMIALDYVWDNIKMDRTKKKAIFIDEIWQLVGASSNSLAADFCLTIFKTIRGFGGAAIAATQDLSDFFGLEDGKYGRAIINNSQNKIILNLEHDEARYVQDVLKLTRTEIHAITRFERGEALLCSNTNKVPISIKASEKEHEMITTDRAELEQILKRKQKETEDVTKK